MQSFGKLLKLSFVISSVGVTSLSCGTRPENANTENYSQEAAASATGELLGNAENLESLSLLSSESTQGVPPTIRDYKALFGVYDPYSKVVDNHGDGFDSLYGVRNFRVVLHGIFYRGGANNAFNKYGTRKNQNPLPTLGLKNLCQTGFTNTVYFYPTNFQSAPHAVSCQSSDGSNSIDYQQVTVLSGTEYLKVLQMIFDRIAAPERGPIYGHCWNGWHASGFISAVALKQFCGYTANEAEDYWIKNTDGASTGYDAIRAKIRGFQPLPKWAISAAKQAEICP